MTSMPIQTKTLIHHTPIDNHNTHASQSLVHNLIGISDTKGLWHQNMSKDTCIQCTCPQYN